MNWLVYIGLFLVGACLASFGAAVVTADWRWLLVSLICGFLVMA